MLDTAMRDIIIRPKRQAPGNAAASLSGLIDASKPYITVCFIVMILLSVWVGLCAE